MPYAPASASDPPRLDPQSPREQRKLRAQLRELPSGGMPIVVAARLSLCFPFLFSAVPVYAVDYEAKRDKRQLRRCLLSDGGLCTNFPIHLFDAACPARPTFGFLLDQRLERIEPEQPYWLPELHLEGRADNWQRDVPGVEPDRARDPSVGGLFGLLGSLLLTMKDWNDRMTGRLPQVRNRVMRIKLRRGEGQLNISMPGKRILRMAHTYGTDAGRALVARYAPRQGQAAPAWREHLYVRLMVELRALRRHLRNFSANAGARGETVSLRELLDRAARERPLAESKDRPDPSGRKLKPEERDAVLRSVAAVEALEAALAANDPLLGPYDGSPRPQIALRTPL
jgi:hypothetical protein